MRSAPGRSACSSRPRPAAHGADPKDAPFGRPTRGGGRAQLAWIDEATASRPARATRSALVTGPVSKHAIASSRRARGAPLSRAHRAPRAAPRRARGRDGVLVATSSSIALVTTHLPISRVPRAITPAKVASAAFHTAHLARQLGKRAAARRRRRAESARRRAGAARTRRGAHASRPASPSRESALHAAHRRASCSTGRSARRRRSARPLPARYDAVVAMYHDQATIPMKLIGFGDAVNVTLGLPIVRTSVDHGTGYDIAGTGPSRCARHVRGARARPRLARSRDGA